MIDKAPDSDSYIDGFVPLSWVLWFEKVRIRLAGDSFTTANRPTSNLYLGKTGFDTNLGHPVWIKSLSPTVWVDGVGTTV